MAGPPPPMDLTPGSPQPWRRGPLSPRGYGFPRIAHQEGEIPPELSPLDAFAAQGRLLAKRLEEERSENGRRASRLPPLAIADALAPPRPFYLRSVSDAGPVTDSPSLSQPGDEVQVEPPTGQVHIQVPDVRPTSCYPRLSTVTTSTHSEPLPSTPLPGTSRYDRFGSDVVDADETNADAASIPRTASPDNYDDRSEERVVRQPIPRSPGTQQSSLDSIGQASMSMKSSSGDATSPDLFHAMSLSPPRPRFGRDTSSIRSVPPESPTEDRGSHLEASVSSLPRKLSSGSAFSSGTPPRSPLFPPHPVRSPSVNSERSMTRSLRARTNFSRPLSRAGRPSLDVPSRQSSSEVVPAGTTTYPDEHNVPTPVSMTSDEYFDASDNPTGPAPAYLYSTFSLPRGRILHRNPNVLRDDAPQQQQHRSEWDANQGSSVGHHPPMASRYPEQRPPSPPSPPPNFPTESSPPPPPSSLPQQSSTVHPSTSPSPHEVNASSSQRPPPLENDDGLTTPIPSRAPRELPRLMSNASASAPQASQESSPVDGKHLSAEEHVNKGIECHERGSLNESTYHLRLAARANHPTAMLLYALACRHGWGMRPNPREGVQWLRKAADLVMLEVADDNGRTTNLPNDILESKTRRAQFALSVYELGVSHMNGWGIEPDKALALRCFEIAGAWGDVDALVEAGFCYAQGVGCKKDLKKSAKFYRMAESKGMSMVGNSWIHKSKYKDDDEDDRRARQPPPPVSTTKAESSTTTTTTNEKKMRDRSRTRTIFGRKKSTA
ncbi:MAG: hypothetical protein M1823_001776 [Watsoniomyces obsoletus]|nr:MAG: hypothetical protein M1823_001776 [Watsoniomyces obsoletus]